MGKGEKGNVVEALSPLGRGWPAAGVFFSRGGPGLRPPKGNRRAVNNIGFGPQAGEGVAAWPTCVENCGVPAPKERGPQNDKGAPNATDPTSGGLISALELSDYYSAESLKIQQEFERTGDGLAVLCRRSDAVDVVVTRLYSRFFSPQPDEPQNFCLLALGGYGRRELFPHSDIDLLFLTESSGEQSSRRDAVAAILRELWDLRLRIGHSVHTLAECGRLYRDNLEFNVALLDCRYLAGDRRLYARLHDEVIPHLVARDHQDLVRNLADMTRQRHAKYGDTIFHLEPNIKEGPGGLRDYHVCRWLARISELEKRKAWSAPEDLWPAHWRAEIGTAFEFLCATRCFLHYLRERDDNQLSYECQDRACARGIARQPAAPLTAADWMRIYFRNVRSIYRLTLRLLDDSAPARAGVYGLFQNWRSRLSNADFSVLREKIYVRQPAALAQDPALLLRLFEMVARHGLELSRDAERAVTEALTRVASQALGSCRVLGQLSADTPFPLGGQSLAGHESPGCAQRSLPGVPGD